MNEFNGLIELEKLFLALADKTRIRLLSLMRGQEIAVGYFSEVLNESQPKISRHLAYLRNAGLVETRRAGKWIHYRISEPAGEIEKRILDEMLDALMDNQVIQKDYKNFAKICRLADVPTITAGAPAPTDFQATSEIEPDRNGENSSAELPVYLL